MQNVINDMRKHIEPTNVIIFKYIYMWKGWDIWNALPKPLWTGKTPVTIIYYLVPNNKNVHKGTFPHSTSRARGRVPEMLYIFVYESVYKSGLSNESKFRVFKYSDLLK